MRSTLFLSLIIGLSLAIGGRQNSGVAAEHEQAELPKRILWVGSSSSLFHSMPSQIAEWMHPDGTATEIEAANVGRGGTAIHEYLRPDFVPEFGAEGDAGVLDHIRRKNYDIVILQVNDAEEEEFQNAIDTYCRVVREAGGKPVL